MSTEKEKQAKIDELVKKSKKPSLREGGSPELLDFKLDSAFSGMTKTG